MPCCFGSSLLLLFISDLTISRAWFVSPYTQSFGQGAPLQTVRGYTARVSHKMEWAQYENPIHTKHTEDEKHR